MAKKDKKTPKPDTSKERGEKGHLLPGNNMWMLRDIHRAPALVDGPEKLLKLCLEYIEFCKENPIFKREAIKGGDRAGDIIEIHTDRPWTIKGFCSFVSRSPVWYRKMRFDNKQDSEFMEIMNWFDNCCESQRLDMALVGIYNPSLVANIDEYKKASYEEAENESKKTGFKIEIVQ